MLREINLNMKPSQMKIYLTKPNRQRVGSRIKDFTQKPQLKLSLGRLNEITFTIPYKVEKHHEFVDNEIVELIRNRFLLHVKWNHVTEWFIINEISDSVDESSEGLVVHAFSLGHELKDKLISELNETSVTPRDILTKALSFTNWSAATIDPKIVDKYRTFETNESTVLDFLYTIANTYGVLLVFDSENKKINLVHPDNYKINRGFKITYGQYLKSLNRSSNSDDMTTRLIVTGKDGLTINRINPTGASYIESFSYFMYPFERDANRNVIQSSHFMSDELCHAILDYEELVESKKGQFSSLLTQLETKQTSKSTKQTELFLLETDLQIIIDEIEVRKAAQQNYSDLITTRDAKQTEVNTKKSEINTLDSDIESIYSQIDSFKSELSVENNFTPELIQERIDYIVTKKWSDSNYIDDQELYEDAKLKFDDIRKPRINITINSVNFFQMIEEQYNWDKVYLGDVVTVRHPMIKTSYEVFLTDMVVSDDSLDLTIADFQEVRKDEALLEKINQSYSSSIDVEMSKYKWNQTTSDMGEINDIINGVWDATKRRIVAGVNESVEISNRGIIIRNPDYPNEIIILQAGVMAISGDNGETWKTVSNARGVFAETLMGKIIAGVNLYIENADGKFRFDKDGATIEGNSFNVIGGRNGVTIDADNGITVIQQNNSIRIVLSATDGFRIQESTNNGTTWTNKFYIDTNGNIVAKGLVIDSESKFANGYDPSTKETPSGAQTKANNAETNAKNHANGIGQGVRDDLRLTSALPTSINMNSSGITAYTSSSDKYARLDHRGLFINKGAIQVVRDDGFSTIIDGKVNQSFDLQGSDPSHLVDTTVVGRFYASDVTNGNGGQCNLYTFRRIARYIVFQVAIMSSSVNESKVILAQSGNENVWLGSASAYNDTEVVRTIVLDLGVPNGGDYALKMMLRSYSTTNTAYCRKIRAYQTDFPPN